MRNVAPGVPEKASGSIAHAADILTCLSREVHTVTGIAGQTRLGKSTVHRVLKLLEHSLLVVQDAGSRQYYLGPMITRLASNPISTHEYLVMCAAEEMVRLSRFSEETVSMDFMVGTQVFPLYEVPSPHDFRVTQERRAYGPVNAGASGKVLLSLLSEKQLGIAMQHIEPARATERTVTSIDVLITQVREIRRQGYAVSYGERIEGVMCISAPVKGYILPVVLSVVGPESRLRPRSEQVIPTILAAAGRISDSISAILGVNRQ